jgi:hypothetical protein
MILAGGFLLSVATTAANSAPLTYGYTGVAGNGTGIFSGLSGESVSGYFTFDDRLIDNDHGIKSDLDTFKTDDPGNEAFVSAFSASLTVGGVTVNASAPAVSFGVLQLADHPFGADAVEYQLWGAAGRNFFSLEALDISNPWDAVAAGSGNLTGTVPGDLQFLNGLDLQKFDVVLARWNVYASNLSVESGLDFTWTTISPVPEPATLSLFGAGLLAGVLVWKRRS